MLMARRTAVVSGVEALSPKGFVAVEKDFESVRDACRAVSLGRNFALARG